MHNEKKNNNNNNNNNKNWCITLCIKDPKFRLFGMEVHAPTFMSMGSRHSLEYRSDDVTKFFGGISVFWIPCIGGA